MRVISCAVLLYPISGCDRNNLSKGPKLTLREDPSQPDNPGGPGPGPGPGPGTTECPTPPSGAAFKGKINEVMPQNGSALPDETGKFVPWIEIYNNTDAELNLGGVPLSDDLLTPNKWKLPCIPETVLGARGFLVVFLDGDTKSETDLHANFILKAEGTVTLALNKGSDIFTFDMSKLSADESAGRFKDGAAGISKLSEPTPGAANKEPAKPPAQGDGTFVRGDSNADGRVNITDMTFTLKVLFQSTPPPACQDRIDSNDDGAVNVTDVLYTGQSLFQRGPPIPPPYPQTGMDPTGDGLACPP